MKFQGSVVEAGDHVRWVRLDGIAAALTNTGTKCGTAGPLSTDMPAPDFGGIVYECSDLGICKAGSVCPDCNIGAGRFSEFVLLGEDDAQSPILLNHESQTGAHHHPLSITRSDSVAPMHVRTFRHLRALP